MPNPELEIDALDDVNVNSIDELRLDDASIQEARQAWTAWVAGHSSAEDAGEAILQAFFEEAPGMQSLFDIPMAAQGGKLVQALTELVSCMGVRDSLRRYLNVLGYMHMSINMPVAAVPIFRNAVLSSMRKDMGPSLNSKASDAISRLVVYAGGALIYIKTACEKRNALLLSSWKESHISDQDDAADDWQDQEDHEDADAEDAEAAANMERGEQMDADAGGMDAEILENEDIHDDEKKSNDGKPRGADSSIALPTTFDEMFQINAAVMGFQRAGTSWMVDALEVLDAMVSHITSTKRRQEETCVMALRLTFYEKSEVALSQFKACLLAALRSTLPKTWTGEHEEAWSWLWDNVVITVEANLEQIPNWSVQLGNALGAISSKRLFKLRKAIYARFFQLAPAGGNFFKQSNTRLHFIADRVLELCSDFFKDPKGMISTLSSLGLRHVGFGIPTDLFVPFLTACIQVMQMNTSNKDAQQAFQWSLILTANVLTRTITEGSTIVMKSINMNSTKALQKAISVAPRGKRATWLLHIQVGDQFISPLMWSIDSGSLKVAEAMLRDLLTIRADRQRYYFGADELFHRHPDFVRRLADKAPDMLPVLLDGLVWRSNRTVKKGTRRRVNYFVQNMLVNKKGKFADALQNIASTGNPKIISHPVLTLIVETLWNGIIRRQFMVSRLWNIISLFIYVASTEILPGVIESHPSDQTLQWALVGVRIACYTFGIGRLGAVQCHKAWIWSRNTFRKILAEIDTDGNGEIDYEEMKEAVSRFKETVTTEVKKALKLIEVDEMEAFAQEKAAAANKQSKMYNRISFSVMLLLSVMLAQDPLFMCSSAANWPTEDCPEVNANLRSRYNLFSALAMVAHFLMLIDLAVFSTEIAAFLLVVGSVMGEMTQFLTALTFLLLLFGSTISILCRACPTGGGNFNDMPNAITSLFAITVGLYQGDYRDIQEDPLLLVCVFTFVTFSVVLLLNLLIAQLNRTYEFINQDMIGFAQLNRASLIVDAMESCPKAKWNRFLKVLAFHERKEFDEGDLGLPGCILQEEDSTLNRISHEMIKRYGGSTSRSLPWPEARATKQALDIDDEEGRLEHMETILQKTLRRMDRMESITKRRHESSLGTSGISGVSGISGDTDSSDGSTGSGSEDF
eukprot:TRINITY_DN7579_c0_g4_i1.p1 TRINITY_DN7579_c0_g4~~TRINITY_DN7579_c0_g4_i1.p1  ORF type:complete len:1142 (+),score=206.60 TRINITY_DN7579_c0_g4_i1:77-3502(+)